ncbi:ATP-binding protein [Paenibacillus ehimensis]|uniref:ATP-binding protein n=1 Tax=Paenibacillus ehimensis TaxID=79264 RepID=A0ABT8VFI1_9BACL|nr:ATP-binding protein [Paenibacillus ehimensis]MDO3679739.1 ATP-binding protein [Paenibacillus ehimensis]
MANTVPHSQDANFYLDTNRPLIPVGSHPIETGEYLIPTNPVLRMFQDVTRWINYRYPGGIIYGRPRLGKTRAIEFLLRTLPNHFGSSLPVFHIKSQHIKLANEGSFFEALLKDVGHKIPFSGKPSVKRDRLYKYLLERGSQSKQKRIVMFIDEAQVLHDLQYGWLMDVFNELDASRIALTVVLVGQEQLRHQRTAYMQANEDQIIGRFMVHEHRFSGIKTAEDLRICLKNFDENSEFPVGSGWSFTRYFFPEAFAAGERLEHFTEDIFNLFVSLHQESKISSKIEIPMQYVIASIERALREYGVGGELQTRWLTTALWKEAIRSSGYINAELRIPAIEEDLEE